MIFLIQGFLCALFGVSPFVLNGNFKRAGIWLIPYTVIGWLFCYLGCFSMNYPMFGACSGIALGFAIISIVITFFVEQQFILKVASPGLGMVLILLIVSMVGFEGCRTSEYSALIGQIDGNPSAETQNGVEHWTQQTQELSPTHIRIVPIEHALSIAKTALNQHAGNSQSIIGSQFELLESYTTLQKVNDEMFYVIPLDYRRFGVWSQIGHVPGFVVVNAEDQHSPPKYIDGYSMKYTPQSYFGQNLERFLYVNGYSNKILSDFTFELNDEMKPFWVVTVSSVTIGNSGEVVEGCIIVDPETGKFDYYELGKAPSWVDRVIPIDIVQSNITYWGKWSSGYWNNTAVGSNTNVREPEATTLNYGADGDCYFVTPVTSTGENDATMTDIIYTNSRTGVSKRYSVSGSTEAAVIKTVNASVQFQHFHASDVVYENVNGRMTAITPILAEDHTIRGLALVDVTTRTMEWDANPLVALSKYQTTTGSFGSVLATDIATVKMSVRDVVDRINSITTSNGTIFYLSFKNATQMFSVPQVYSEILLTQRGDSVYISFLEKSTDILAAEDFDNLSLDIHYSENQQDVIDRAKVRKEETDKETSRQSVKNQIKNGEISNEILDSLALSVGKKK